MARTYTLKKRAEQQTETRNRIVEAAVDLHSTIGPAATSLSMIAERAGVQRHTLYAHFPDERSLLLACSGHVQERDPLPEASAWSGIVDRKEKLETALTAIYSWYERNAALMASVMRDAEYYAPVQEIAALRIAPFVAGWQKTLGAKLNAKQRATLRLALSYFTWRTLVRESGLSQRAAIAAMIDAIECGNSAKRNQ